MRRPGILFVLLAGLLVHAIAQTPPVVRATGTTPDPANRLAPSQSLYVRVAYESDQPLRFQAAGYYQGRKKDNLAMNPSGTYPAGQGEGLVWLFGSPGARIDEIRVRVCDARWNQLLEVPVPVAAEWHAGVAAAPDAPWAAELVAAQSRLVNAAMSQPGAAPDSLLAKLWFALAAVITPFAFLCTPGYPLLQAYAFWKLRGPARLLSALPLTFMLPVYAFCVYALTQQSNLWPLYAIFASPVAFIITLVVVLVARRRAKAAAITPTAAAS